MRINISEVVAIVGSFFIQSSLVIASFEPEYDCSRLQYVYTIYIYFFILLTKHEAMIKIAKRNI